MSDLHLPDSITERIQAIAEQEQLSVEEVLQRMLQNYSVKLPAQKSDEPPTPDPLLGLIDLLSDETQETNLSNSVRENLAPSDHTSMYF